MMRAYDLLEMSSKVISKPKHTSCFWSLCLAGLGALDLLVSSVRSRLSRLLSHYDVTGLTVVVTLVATEATFRGHCSGACWGQYIYLFESVFVLKLGLSLLHSLNSTFPTLEGTPQHCLPCNCSVWLKESTIGSLLWCDADWHRQLLADISELRI